MFLHVPPQGKLRYSLFILVACLALISTGCGSPGLSGVSPQQSSSSQPMIDGTSTAQILLFNGTGTTSTDVSAVESLLGSLKLVYTTANTEQIEGMTQSQLEAYKLLIVPGGNSITIGDNLSTSATNNIHNAVVDGGLHYFGVCAGAFFGGYSIYNGLDLTSGVWFNVYANDGKGTGKTAVEISYPDGPKLDQYWQDGPELDGWGDIVAKYPDGTSAIVEGASGKGWVLLSGIHAEAPADWRTGMTFTTSVTVDNAYFETMVTAALAGTSLPHY
jgi:hypothetical protein